MNKRRNIYRGMNRRRNHISKGITVGLVVVVLAGGAFFIKKSDFSFTEKISSLNIFNKKELGFKEFSYKDLLGKGDDSKTEAKTEDKSKDKEVKKEQIDRGVLYTSGLIAGEGLVGVLLAIFAVIKIGESSLADIINLSDFVNLGQIGSVIFFALLILTLFKFTIWYKDKNKAS